MPGLQSHSPSLAFLFGQDVLTLLGFDGNQVQTWVSLQEDLKLVLLLQMHLLDNKLEGMLPFQWEILMLMQQPLLVMINQEEPIIHLLLLRHIKRQPINSIKG